MPKASGIFADNAMAMHRHGLAVLPLGIDRTPRVMGFDQWKTRPGKVTITKWMRAHPTDNIAIVPSLSGVLVADCDDASQDQAVEDLLGPTPLKVVTRRGRHRYYRKINERLPGNLRFAGLQVDLKASGIVIAPPSVHESGHIYRLEGDWSALRDLPPPHLQRLAALLVKGGCRDAISAMRDGSRGQWLNDQLCKCAMACASFEDLLQRAVALNDELEVRGFGHLPEAEVLKRAQKVWNDAQSGKLRPASVYKDTLKTSLTELDLLSRTSRKHGPEALLLMLKLRAMHTDRCRRGETFCLTPRSMANAGMIAGWSRERFQHARNVLLQAGLIVQVTPFRRRGDKRQAAQYRLAEKGADGHGAGG
jgi:hypothetical protein